MIYDSILSIGLIFILAGMCMADSKDLRPSFALIAIGGLILFVVEKAGNYYDK